MYHSALGLPSELKEQGRYTALGLSAGTCQLLWVHVSLTSGFQIKFVVLTLREGILVNKMDTVFNEKQKFHFLKMILQCVALGSYQDYSMQVILKDPNL